MMKRVLASLLAMGLAAPALAQQGASEIEAEGKGVINRWIAAFNKGDTSAMLKDVYAAGDAPALTRQFDTLRSDSFGKLDVYSASFCGSDQTHGKALVKYGKLFTYGGLMDGDEARVFELVKTDAGWRIGVEKSVAYNSALSCS